MPSVLVTGANGFLGTALCKKLLDEDFNVRGAVRPGKESYLPKGIEVAHIDSLDGDTDWEKGLKGVDTVVHLAARVHVMNDTASDPFVEYRKVNVLGSERLAHVAAECDVKRFIFVSSIKVNGEENVKPYKETDAPNPRDSYGISKLQAEKRLESIAAESGMELVILRPPLVYGPNVKANFLELIKIVDKGTPLPLSSTSNRRSFIYIENLVDAIIRCMEHPAAAGQIYLVSDDEDVSTSKLIRKIAQALNKSTRLFPFPEFLLFFIGRMMGKGPAVDRLIGSLTVDISKISQELGWKPPFSMAQGLQKTIEWYKNLNTNSGI